MTLSHKTKLVSLMALLLPSSVFATVNCPQFTVEDISKGADYNKQINQSRVIVAGEQFEWRGIAQFNPEKLSDVIRKSTFPSYLWCKYTLKEGSSSIFLNLGITKFTGSYPTIDKTTIQGIAKGTIKSLTQGGFTWTVDDLTHLKKDLSSFTEARVKQHTLSQGGSAGEIAMRIVYSVKGKQGKSLGEVYLHTTGE